MLVFLGAGAAPATARSRSLNDLEEWTCDEGSRSVRDATTYEPLKPGIILVVGTIDSSFSLLFDGLPDPYFRRLVVVEPTLSPAVAKRLLVASSAVFFLRLIEPTGLRGYLLDLARTLDVPHFYVADDDLSSLHAERADLSWYTPRNLRACLDSFAAVIVTSAPLLATFRALSLHPRIFTWRPTLSHRIVELLEPADRAERREGMRIGFIGGPFRIPNLSTSVMPALEALARSTDVTLLIRPETEIRDAKIPIEVVPFHRSYKDFIMEWRDAECDILVHSKGESANIANKTQNILICSYYIGAVPILAREPAYEGLGPATGVLLADQPWTAPLWAAALKKAETAERRAALRRKLAAYCQEAFAPAHNLPSLEACLRMAPPPSWQTWEERWALLCHG